MFKIQFPTKRIFRIFHILRINGMAPFCNLFMERPSYMHTQQPSQRQKLKKTCFAYQITAESDTVMHNTIHINTVYEHYQTNIVRITLCT